MNKTGKFTVSVTAAATLQPNDCILINEMPLGILTTAVVDTVEVLPYQVAVRAKTASGCRMYSLRPTDIVPILG